MRIAFLILLAACGHQERDITDEPGIDAAIHPPADADESANECMGSGEPLRFELSWQGDADLDLHVVQGDRDTRLCDTFWDCHAGHATTQWEAAWSSPAPGTETVRVARAIPGPYYAYVHAKTGTATDVTLRITTFHATRTIHRVQLNAGSVWAGAHAWFEYDFVNCGDAYWCLDGNEEGVVVPDTGLGTCTMRWSFPWEGLLC